MDVSKVFSMKTEISDFCLVTHAVPVRRLRRILPKNIELDTFYDEKNQESLGFISVGCFKNKHFHYTPVIRPEMNFFQVTFRTYVRFQGKPAVYFFGSDLGTWPSFALQKLSSPIVEKGNIELLVNRDRFGDYDIYECSSRSEHGFLDVSLRAKRRPAPQAPFDTGAKKSYFLTHRLHGLMKTVYGAVGDQVVEHKVMRPLEGELLDFKCDFWIKLGLLKEEEARERFFSVLVTPSVEFTFYPPIPSQLARLAA